MAISPEQSDLHSIYVAGPTQALDWLIISPLALCIVTGALLIIIRDRTSLQPVIAIAALVGLVLLDVALLMRVMAEGPLTMVMGRWLPPFGIAFTVDLTGAILALAAAVVALAGGIFALNDSSANERRYGFYPFLMLMMAGVTGAFITGDIFNLYVWFEVLLISSFGLMVLGGERPQLDGAAKYGLLNLIATTLFLVATGYLYSIFGTLNMADIARKAANMPVGAPMFTLASLYLMAFAMKAAAFPLNFWLPASYHTPKIAVSALFAGLLTKVGVYALLRTLVMLFPLQRVELAPVIAAIAIVTMLLGAFSAFGQHDMRRILGQVVISGIGFMMAGLALGTQSALTATLFYAAHSMAVVSGLYFMAGIAAEAGKSFSLNRLSGLWTVSAPFSALALILVLAASGLPPFTGFWPKAMLTAESLKTGHPLIAAAILLSGFLTMLAVGRLFLFVFWRSLEDGEAASPISAARLAPMVLVTLPLVFFGLWPEPLMVLAGQAAGGLLDPSSYLQSVFPGGPNP